MDNFFKECMLFQGKLTAQVIGAFTWILLPLFVLAIFYITKDDGFYDEDEDSIEVIVKYGLEEAYFEGQKDAIEGDIRIEKKDSTYVWIKSPWDSGAEPVFIP